MPPLPMASPAAAPTRLLALPATPTCPLLMSSHVTAPAPLAKEGERTRKLSLERTVMPPLLIRSPVAAPTRLLEAPITPVIPLASLAHVAAPAWLLKSGELTIY